MRFLLILQNDFIRAITEIKTPLMLASLFAAIIFFTGRQILGNFKPKRAKEASGLELSRTILKYLFILALVAMVFGFIGFTLPFLLQSKKETICRKDLSPAECEASTYQDRVMELKGSWENMEESETDRQKTNEKAPKLARLILSINDNDLRPAWQVLKYEYALYAYTMAASTQTIGNELEREAKLQYASAGLTAGEKALGIISNIRNNGLISENHQKALRYIVDEEVEERVNYLSAICLCRKADVLNDVSSRKQATERIARIPPNFLNQYPLAKNPEFIGCLENLRGVQ